MWRYWVAAMIFMAGGLAVIEAAIQPGPLHDWAIWTIILWIVVVVGVVTDREPFRTLALLAILPAILMTGLMAFAPGANGG